ncbi:GL25524 [Drosophila persimilis]|uniref:GL25524 n=1 Tax=Drosophila persimilis TaxID=7234 RepID=B4GJD1_DROPE|nr:GL25524 [Drosophila persimilis]
MSGEKVALSAELRFGVDHLEFSCVPEFWPTTQKYSIESSYSMLVGLQTGASNGLEGRSKYAWPNVGSNANNTIKTSDLDQTEFESDSFSNNSGSGRLSFSPDMFSLDYEAVPLDELFAKAAPVVRTPAMSMPQMMQVLKQQQTKLKNVEQKIRSYSKPSNLADDSLEHCRNTPEYVQKLRAIIRAIDNIGRDNGFRTCSMEQLESFMYFLSEYADVCLANCSEHMDKILDTLLDRRSVEV